MPENLERVSKTTIDQQNARFAEQYEKYGIMELARDNVVNRTLAADSVYRIPAPDEPPIESGHPWARTYVRNDTTGDLKLKTDIEIDSNNPSDKVVVIPAGEWRDIDWPIYRFMSLYPTATGTVQIVPRYLP